MPIGRRFKLKPAKSFDDVTDNPDMAKKLSQLYDGDINKLEWFVGLFAEKQGDDMIMGDMLLNMVAHDAFTHALTNPLLSVNVFNENTFSKTGFDIIKNTTTLSQIVRRVTHDFKTCRFSSVER